MHFIVFPLSSPISFFTLLHHSPKRLWLLKWFSRMDSTAFFKTCASFAQQLIDGIPTYKALAKVNLKLNPNAASVHSNLGDGTHGLLTLSLDPVIYYLTVSNIPFIAPVNPGPQLIIPAAATATQISGLTHEHKANHQLWRKYLATNKALKQQLLGAINKMYFTTTSLDMQTSQPCNCVPTCTPHMATFLPRISLKMTNA
jgi:hypothetical protein